MIGGLSKSTSRLALIAAAGFLVGSVAMPSAKAADLGGDCCADLEERVAELEATTARKGNRKMSLTISGQVSTMVMYWRDGGSSAGGKATSRASDAYIVDNVMGGGTFLNFAGTARITPDMTAGYQVAISFLAGHRSHQVNQGDDIGYGTFPNSALGDTYPVVHLSNWFIESGSLGRVTIGRANLATAGLTTIDLGGAGVIANASIGYTQRSMFVIDDLGFLRTTTWSSMMGGGTVNGSSLARGNAVVYSSPTLGGFNVQAAVGENNVWDAALRYAGEFSGFRFAAGVGYIYNATGLKEITTDSDPEVGGCNNGTITGIVCHPSQWKGSASLMHVASGLYLTGAYVNQDNDQKGVDNTTLWYAQGGITKNWFGPGATTLYGEWSQVDHGLQGAASGSKFLPFTDSRVTVWGVGVVQAIDAAAMEVFLAYRRYTGELENVPGKGFGPNSIEVQDMDVVMGGARVKF